MSFFLRCWSACPRFFLRKQKRERGLVPRTPSIVMMREEGTVNGGRDASAESARGIRGAAQNEHEQREANGIGSDAGLDGGDVKEDDLGAGRASYGDDLDTLDRRRTEELKLIGEYDS